MGKIKEITGRILYGSLFIIVIPAILILWSKYTDYAIKLPLPDSRIPGFILLIAGGIFLVTGMLYLFSYGKGLPMNAFPPVNFVKKGIYAFTSHPIYSGAVMLCFGLAAITGSSSGFWLVSPFFALMTTAYVVGFENERTLRIFGKQDYNPFLSLPPKTDITPGFKDRISSYFLVFIPWVLGYEIFIFTGIPADAIPTNLTFESQIPVIEPSVIFYTLTYLFALAVPLIIKSNIQLRSFITDVWFATFIGCFIYFLLPFIVKQREFMPETFFGRYLLFERSIDGETGAFPSFHVIWGFLAAYYFGKNVNKLNWLWYLIAILISISCITTGNHSISDVIGGIFTFLLVIYRLEIWNFIRQQSEKISNSWKEWRFGQLRIINHGFYGGASGFAGTLIAGFFLGPQNTMLAVIVMIFVVIGAGLWAQIIEGSPKLLRPYGYYGGLTGGLLACAFISLFSSVSFCLIVGSFAMAAPWIQSIGRLRCLVQGCCHGKPSDENIGLRFTHPKSRVNKISGLAGIPLYPTQLYSIGTNIVTGLILIRLYAIGFPSSFIIGIYLILNGTGRFVEESFRGEAQTPYWAGMRIYQWIAIINILAGIVFTTIQNTDHLTFSPGLSSVFAAIGIGVIVTFASGIDFPDSNSRFARLTSN
jgi:protein-S-isoprenylcysteine O-methyltransferase Ste14